MSDENDERSENEFEEVLPTKKLDIVVSDSEEDDFMSEEDTDSDEDSEEFTTDDAMIVTDRLMVNSANIQSYILEYPNLPDNIRERVQRAVDELENAYQEISEYL